MIPLDDFQNNEITKNIFDLITEQNLDFSLDVSIFESNCYSINQILANYGLFLRVYELKNNYRKFTIKTPNKQNQIKQLASCILQKFNGFEILKNEFAKREKQNLIPVDIIYIPTKNVDILPECYYTTEIQNAYTTLYQDNGLTRRSFLAYECYYCNKFFCKKDKHLRHFKVCTSKPGITYNFCTKTLCSYEDNFKSKGDIPFSIYFDFETTASTDSDWLNHEDKKMFVVSYAIVVAFHPFFKDQKKIHVLRSYSHTREQLITIPYLTEEQFAFRPKEVISQLYDQANEVFIKTSKNAIVKMFGIELAFIKQTLLAWYNKKIAPQFKFLSEDKINEFRTQNPYNSYTKCCICKFPMGVLYCDVDRPTDKMNYYDFVIRYEYKFIRNIFSEKDLARSVTVNNIENYYKYFDEFIQVTHGLLNWFNNGPTPLRRKDLHFYTVKFVENNFNDWYPETIHEEILETEIRNLGDCKGIPRNNLKF